MKAGRAGLFMLPFLFIGCSEETPGNEEASVEANNEEEENNEKDEKNKESNEESNSEVITPESESLGNLSYTLLLNDEETSTVLDEEAVFPAQYTEIDGVLTFRGDHKRTSPSFGSVSFEEFTLQENWHFTTDSDPEWGGGAGWTGQPVIVKWEDDIKQMMNLKDEYKEKDDFIEVIQGSLDGNIYFLDKETGKQTREPIYGSNPIKGSVSVDSRGYPLLYAGDGVPHKKSEPFGFNIYDLTNYELLHHIDGRDSSAYRDWGAFDSSALVNRKTDMMVVGGENGYFYSAKLNTEFDRKEGTVDIDPDVAKMRYEVDDNDYQGIENSVAIYNNLAYFADNGGSIIGMDLTTKNPVWALPPLDDTDATIVIEEIEGVPYLYTGSEVDNVGEDGEAFIRKINGLTGEEVWKQSYSAFYYPGVIGGVLATPILGKENIDDLVIFTVARHKERYSGIMAALDRETGEEVWRWEMPDYAWSSPVDIYDEEGNSYIIQADFGGNLTLLNAETGEVLDQLNLGSNIEASPAVYENTIIVASRDGNIYSIELK
ncbi:outer membrane protein assembly factor BamB family protein [Bacillus sp. FJAT-44742]|uniref:outer membrane protein assembly factor BamB family protein n=1 Tax=Bacillus sp. FJAT-44742 TaxID=2014005 RepID=UPI0012FE9418|nr:PQQ-binding-like beta-propeller repeat protein [Bacillus sp. FJAT-44742]